MLKKTFKFRLCPTKQQVESFNRLFTFYRLIYNYFLNSKISTYNLTGKILNLESDIWFLNHVFYRFPFMSSFNRSFLIGILYDLNYAFNGFVDHNYGFPKYKKKSNKSSIKFTYYRNEYVGDKRIFIPSVGYVKYRNSAIIQGKVSYVVVRMDTSFQYFISIVCEVEKIDRVPMTNRVIGLDMGLEHFLVTDRGIRVVRNRFLSKSIAKLKLSNKILDRKKYGSENWKKQRKKLALLHKKINNQRKDFLHKLSTIIVKNFDIICVEDLNIGELIKNKKYSRSINDAAWYEFVRMLQYKSEWYGKKLVKISRWFPSSQLCSFCGFRNKNMKDLKVRQWKCPRCHRNLDRDVNAARNILNEGMRRISLDN